MIGQLLNQYRLEEIVGKGGMGVVYRALDMNLERTVAVKILSASLRDDPEFIDRFRQEARIQAGLNHPNIATLFDFFVWNDMPVAVMEFIKGETLRSMVDRRGPIPAHVALPIFIQALRGVAAGHKRGIIHRDLKPSNLMITEEGTVKITDFGIAKVRSNTGLTRESTRVGSAKYMAPEQILGRPVDERTDIYIMGGTLYELLTGRPPFQGVSQFEIDFAHVRDRPKLPTEYCPNIPPAAVDAVMRALAKEPGERFSSAEQFIQALPDLHGVPYTATVTIDEDATRLPHSAAQVAPAPTPGTASPDKTLLQQNPSKSQDAQRQDTALPDATLLRPNALVEANTQHREVTSPVAMPPTQNQPKAAPARRAGTAILIGGLIVGSIAGVVWYKARQADVGTAHNPPSPTVLDEQPRTAQQTQPTETPSITSTTVAADTGATTAPVDSGVATTPVTAGNTAPPDTGITSTPPTTAPPTAALNGPPDAGITAPPGTAVNTPPRVVRKPAATANPLASAALEDSRDLSGIWTGTYRDSSGKALLQLLNLQIQQVPDGAITGRFNYKAGGSSGEDCTLDKSSYSTQSKRLRLITHCRNPDHPKYFNVPLEFVDVDPGATTIKGGRLAFHLADDIVVTLKRAKGI